MAVVFDACLVVELEESVAPEVAAAPSDVAAALLSDLAAEALPVFVPVDEGPSVAAAVSDEGLIVMDEVAAKSETYEGQ